MKDLAKKDKNPFAYRQRHGSNDSRVTERQMAHCNARPDMFRGPEWIRTSSLMGPPSLRLTHSLSLNSTAAVAQSPIYVVECHYFFLKRFRTPIPVEYRPVDYRLPAVAAPVAEQR